MSLYIITYGRNAHRKGAQGHEQVRPKHKTLTLIKFLCKLDIFRIAVQQSNPTQNPRTHTGYTVWHMPLYDWQMLGQKHVEPFLIKFNCDPPSPQMLGQQVHTKSCRMSYQNIMSYDLGFTSKTRNQNFTPLDPNRRVKAWKTKKDALFLATCFLNRFCSPPVMPSPHSDRRIKKNPEHPKIKTKEKKVITETWG